VPQVCVYYSGEVLWDQGDVDRALLSETELATAKGGELPVVWLILNFDLERVPEQRLAEFEVRFELQIVRSGLTFPDRFA
jgi:hypothetical protein